jgi:hypothetical protein
LHQRRPVGGAMLVDLVVDSNVLSHAQNPGDPNFEDAGILLEKLANSSTLLCMDGRFTIGAGNSSLIGQEYLENVGFGGVAFSTLQLLMQTDRIKVVSIKVPLGEKKVIDSLVPNNKRDRTFVRVAFNSLERRLVSHDFEDFTHSVRKKVSARLGVVIQEAFDVHPDILPDDDGSDTDSA